MPDAPKNNARPEGDKPQTFEEYVKEHGEKEAVPFDDVLRKLVQRAPRQANRPKE